MLQRAAQRLVLQPQGMLQAACYSTKMPDDYSLVMKNTQKELANHSAAPEKEIGLCSGAPLETFTRKVCTAAHMLLEGLNSSTHTIWPAAWTAVQQTRPEHAAASAMLQWCPSQLLSATTKNRSLLLSMSRAAPAYQLQPGHFSEAACWQQ